MYPTFLREGLSYSPTAAGSIMGLYGLGALTSIGGGWIGDRGSPRLVLSVTFVVAAVLGYLLFNGSGSYYWQATLAFAWGVVVSGVMYVNLAGYHVKAVRRTLAGRASGVFVTSLYLSAAGAGYLMGWIADEPDGETPGRSRSRCPRSAPLHLRWHYGPRRCRSGRGEDERLAAPDDDGVFLVDGEAAVVRAQGPAIGALDGSRRDGGEHRLDGDHQSLGQGLLRQPVLVVRHVRTFMDRPSDAVPAQFAYDSEPISSRLRIDGTPDHRDSAACVRHFERGGERGHGARLQPDGDRRSLIHDDRTRGIRDVAVVLGRDVNLDDVARLQVTVARHAVNDFLVDADARIARKAVGELRRRPRPQPLHRGCANSIQLQGRHTAPDRRAHLLENECDNPSDSAHPDEVGL